MLNMVKKVLKAGRRDQWLPENFLVDLEPVTVPKYTAKLLTLDQIRELANHAGLYGPAALLGGICGLRSAEICALMWADFAGDPPILTIARQNRTAPGGGHTIKEGTKGRRGSQRKRAIPLIPEVLAAVNALPKRSVYLFPDPQNMDLPLNIYDMRLIMQQAMKDAGVPVVRVHDLRHSAGNALKQAGVQVKTIADILGHSTVSVTQDIYQQTITNEMIEAMSKLNPAARFGSISLISQMPRNGSGPHRDARRRRHR